MKKGTALALALVLFLLCLPAQAETMMVSTPGGRLNLRAQPDMNAQTLRYIPNGEVVALLEQVNDTWCKVSWDGSVGYARSQFIAPVEEALQKEYPDAENAYPDALFIYVRAEKDGLSAVVDTVEADTQLTILEDDGSWCHVVYYKRGYLVEGYVSSFSLQNRRETSDQGTDDLLGREMLVTEKAVTLSQQNLYLYPDMTSAVTVTLPQGTEVMIDETLYPWCHVSCGAFVGWMLAEDVQLTGEQGTFWQDHTFYNYVASHYTATANDGKLQVYIYPRSELDMVQRTVEYTGTLMVLEKNRDQYGHLWAQVWDGADFSGWVLADTLTFSEEREEYVYQHNVDGFSSATAYVKAGGARVLANGSPVSEVVAVLPEDTEVIVRLNARGYAHVSYLDENKNEINGYISYDELDLGFALQTDKDRNNPGIIVPEELPLEQLRQAADEALLKACGDIALQDMTVTSRRGQNPSGSVVYYEFSYYLDGRYLYAARIDAATGGRMYVADLRPFYDDVRTSRQDALAVVRTAIGNRGGDPDALEVEYLLSQDMKVHHFSFYDGEGQLVYDAAVDVAGGHLLYLVNRQQVEQELAREALSREAAQAIADAALQGKYPGFDPAVLTVRYDRGLVDDKVVHQFAYYDENGKYAYAAHVSNTTGEAVLIADYTAFVESTVTPRPVTPRPTSVPASTPAPTAEPVMAALSMAQARALSDSVLESRYAEFDLSLYTNVHENRKERVADIVGPLYQFDYYTADDSGYACCMVDVQTGEVLYTSNVLDTAKTEINYDPTPVPTQAPDYEGMAELTEAEVRAIADSSLAGKYPEFTSAAINRVDIRYVTENTGVSAAVYHVDYFDESGQYVYGATIHAVTGEVLYTFGSLPGEANG